MLIDRDEFYDILIGNGEESYGLVGYRTSDYHLPFEYITYI